MLNFYGGGDSGVMPEGRKQDVQPPLNGYKQHIYGRNVPCSKLSFSTSLKNRSANLRIKRLKGISIENEKKKWVWKRSNYPDTALKDKAVNKQIAFA